MFPGLALKQIFYLDGYAISINELKYTSRVKWRLENMSPTYVIDFNETQGIWFRDRIDNEFVSRTRSVLGESQSVYWAYDPFAPKLCHDRYETLDHRKLICSSKKIQSLITQF